MIVQQINTTLNTAAPGRIAEEIGKVLLAHGHSSYIGFGRSERPSESKLIKIGNNLDQALHGAKTRLFDKHGFGSHHATARFVKQIDNINPDIIHLHNIHGYYLNVEVLFRYLKQAGKPVVWTLHDCWPFTGHCSYFDFVNCFRWETECHHCPNRHAYPKSWLADNSRQNFYRKKELFTGVEDMVFISPSEWLAQLLKRSFLRDYPVHVIRNGIDLHSFRPMDNSSELRQKYQLGDKKILLGVASIWDRRKGFNDFIKLSKKLSENELIVLIGLNHKQAHDLPANIRGIARTENLSELAGFYSLAEVFVNPTYVDNFPTTNLEALACGTPVVTYNTGGSPEAIDDQTGLCVPKGETHQLHNAIGKVMAVGKEHFRPLCRARAEDMYNKENRYMDYLGLYNKLLKIS
jgi:glycosyltransferase involved in cell wall biosynthesis